MEYAELFGLALQDTHTVSSLRGLPILPVSLCLKANGTEVLGQTYTYRNPVAPLMCGEKVLK